MTPPIPVDAVDLEVVKASLRGIVQEMQNALFRTGFSTIIRESQDASCALMDHNGDVVAQHVVLPLHIGAFPACCAAVLKAFGDTIGEGDAFLINHPYHGGSPHAPDIAVITPVFVDGALFGFCGSIAHKSDIGGPVPGSCSGQAREIFNEGLQLPAVRYETRYVRNGDLERIIAANSRTPELVLGDIRGQLGADRLGERRLIALARKHGAAKIRACYERLFEMARGRVRLAVAGWTDGRFEAERFVDDDGIELERPVRIHVAVDKHGDTLHFDFTGSADQTRGPANIRPPLVQAACAYCLISLIDPHIHVCSGLLQGFSIAAREGSVLNPRFPAPVNTYNPTVHALVDAIFAALSHVAPTKARADGSGSRSIILGSPPPYPPPQVGGAIAYDATGSSPSLQSKSAVADFDRSIEWPKPVSTRFRLGEGRGGGSGGMAPKVPPGTTPTPDPSPQGGGEPKGGSAFGRNYVHYEIVAGGAGARASKDGASGITVNQSNARIAPVEIIESEFPTRLLRFDLIADSGGAGRYRGGLGLRREYLNLEDARFSIRSMKHVIPPHGCAGGGDGRAGDIVINPDTPSAKRLPTRYADYPLRAGDVFRLDTPGGGGFGDPIEREPERVLADVQEGYVSPETAERDHRVVLAETEDGLTVDAAATARKRNKETP